MLNSNFIASVRIHHVAFVATLLLGSAAHAQVPTDVTITNPPTNPGQVVNPRDTFPVVLTQTVAAFSGAGGTATFLNAAPEGYRLIIEHVSLHARTPVGQRFWGIIHPCDNLMGSPWGITPLATTSLIEDSTFTNSLHQGIAETALYVDPGCILKVNLQRNSSTGGFGAWVTIHGHYVPQSLRALPAAAAQEIPKDVTIDDSPGSPAVLTPRVRPPL